MLKSVNKYETSGQKTVRESEILDAQKGVRAKTLKAMVGTALLTAPASSLTTLWLSRNENAPTKSQASAFDKAFSKAHNAGDDTFMFKGKEYTTDVRKGKQGGGSESIDDLKSFLEKEYPNKKDWKKKLK